MPARQRILVVSTTADAADLRRCRAELGSNPLLLAAPTAEARRVVGVLEVEPLPEVLLAPVGFPEVDRGHRLDALVRSHALQDRFRVVVVVADPATCTLLLRVLAPNQPPTGAVTVVGLPRGDRPVAVRRGLVLGVVLGVMAGVAQPDGAALAFPAAVGVTGLVLLLVVPWRHVGRELLLVAAVASVVFFLGVAGSARFPGTS